MKRDDDSSNDDARFEREAAAVHLAHGGAADEELPRALARRIEADAVRHVQNAHAERRASARASASAATSTTAAGAQVVLVEMPAPTPLRKLDVVRWSGWLAAAACAALFATTAYRGRAETPSASSGAAVSGVEGHGASLYRVEGSPDTELAWSDASQRGTLRVRALPPTDASSEYQVWLARANDSERFPTPVGRFRVLASAPETTVWLVSPVSITAPDRLIVTREALGGVLVSKREHVLLEGRLGAR